MFGSTRVQSCIGIGGSSGPHCTVARRARSRFALDQGRASCHTPETRQAPTALARRQCPVTGVRIPAGLAYCLLAAASVGCGAFRTYRPMTVQVIDGETRQPLSGAKVTVAY